MSKNYIYLRTRSVVRVPLNDNCTENKIIELIENGQLLDGDEFVDWNNEETVDIWYEGNEIGNEVDLEYNDELQVVQVLN